MSAKTPYLLCSFLLIVSISATPPTSARPVRGLLVYGHETHTLQPCGRDRVMWVITRKPLRQALQQRYQQLAKTPYEPVYAELEGEINGTGEGEFAKLYDGTFELYSIVTLSRQGVEACRNGDPPSSKLHTYVFACADRSNYVVRTRPGSAWVFRPEGSLQLSEVPGNAGTRFVGEDFELHIQGETAQITEAGAKPKPCRNDRRKAVWERAKLNGADFRAVGNEPGWELLIIDGRIILTTDYSVTHIEAPLPPAVTDQKTLTTVWKCNALTVEASARRCRDTMTDTAYESTVTVRLPGKTLHGCGMALH